MASASAVKLDPNRAGVYHVPNMNADSTQRGSELLQINHDQFHVFFNSKHFHNHMAHHLLTLYALGATPEELQKAYDDNADYQRPQFPIDKKIVEDMSDPEKFKKYFGQERYFHDYEAFFRKEIEAKGLEKTVNEHLLADTEVAKDMFYRLFSGVLHPIIHFGFGIEFQQPAIVIEGLAQTAIHKNEYGDWLESVKSSPKSSTKGDAVPLVKLLEAARTNQKIKDSVHWEDGDKKESILTKARAEMTDIASQWFVKPEELELRTAEMINAAAFFTAAAQNPRKRPTMDFFYIHSLNCSIFSSAFLEQKWISTQDKIRLLEGKAHMDLLTYAACGSRTLLPEEIKQYKPKEAGQGWKEIFRRVDSISDDGHLSKFVRALAHGEVLCSKYEKQHSDLFAMKGAMWLQAAHMAVDAAEGQDPLWIYNTGFEESWEDVPDRAAKL